jgi:hypothetical protein
MGGATLPDGLVVFVKLDCATCRMIAPVLVALDGAVHITVFSQDDPSFPPGLVAVDDTQLEASYRHGIETVPTLMRVEGGRVVDRLEGWMRNRWEELTGIGPLGVDLPEYRPGCGSASVEPGMPERLAARYSGDRLTSRRILFGADEDEFEAAFARGWSDGLPVVPPTAERVFRMLQGTSREAHEVVAVVPPNLVECTVEKVAINAVLAGCRPEYLPVVIAALRAACSDEFNMHGVLATTYFSGPILIVNGPIAREIGLNSSLNALGQGNRANSTIGRAFQLIIRNVGGGTPGGVDRAALGNPGKLGFCFAEREVDSPWEPLHVERGFKAGDSTVTVFAGQGPAPISDERSRSAESLIRTFAACLDTSPHPNLALEFDAILVVPPDHARIFRDAGWTKQRMRAEIQTLLTRPGRERARGAGGMDDGMPPSLADSMVSKFSRDGLFFVHAGGNAGAFTGIISGWSNANGGGSTPVTVAITK